MRWRELIALHVVAAGTAVALAVLCSGRLAHAIGEQPGVGIQQDGGLPYPCEVFELPSASWATPTLAGSTCTLTPLGGSGGTAAILAFSGCTPIDGNAQVYLGPGTCADPNEPIVQARVKNAATLGQLACQLSGTTGAQSVTVTARGGTCGGLVDSALTCTIGASADTCSSTGTVALTAGQCVSFRVTATGALPAPRGITCTVQRTA